MKIIEEHWRGNIVHKNFEEAVPSACASRWSGDGELEGLRDRVTHLEGLVGRLMDALVLYNTSELVRALGVSFTIKSED